MEQKIKMKNKLLILLLAVFSLSKAYASPMSAVGKVQFVAIGKPSAIKIRGEGEGVTGDVKLNGSEASASLDFPIDKFTTGVDLRDKHMKEKYLEIEKFQKAHLNVDTIKLSASPLTDGFDKKDIPFTGILKLHGVDKPVKGTVDLHTAGKIIHAEAAFEIKITDYNITIPSYLGITVADTVQVKVQLDTEKIKSPQL
jgi:polyisoprenoid-binding protein YceI